MSYKRIFIHISLYVLSLYDEFFVEFIKNNNMFKTYVLFTKVCTTLFDLWVYIASQSL